MQCDESITVPTSTRVYPRLEVGAFILALTTKCSEIVKLKMTKHSSCD